MKNGEIIAVFMVGQPGMDDYIRRIRVIPSRDVAHAKKIMSSFEVKNEVTKKNIMKYNDGRLERIK
jgi:hypothetical protein